MMIDAILNLILDVMLEDDRHYIEWWSNVFNNDRGDPELVFNLGFLLFLQQRSPLPTSENDWDSFHSWDGTASNSFLVGMESYHSNKKEDRKYTFFHTRSDDWVLSECTSKWVNGWDEDINVVLDSNKVIAGNVWGYNQGRNSKWRNFSSVPICLRECGGKIQDDFHWLLCDCCLKLSF